MGQQDFTTPGSASWTTPTAVKAFDIYLIGGGGGSSYSGGGGGGAYIDKLGISTSPGTTWNFTVGAGSTTNGAATNWNSGQFISGGGSVASGGTGGAGGTVSGSGTPSHSSSGGNGGNDCTTDSTICTNCTCDMTCDGDMTCDSMTCDNPPDCTSSSCAHFSCNSTYSCSSAYRCASTSTTGCSAIAGGGSSGTLSGHTNGDNGGCFGSGSDNCGYATGASCTDGNGGGAPDSPGGSGGNAGSNGSAPGGGSGGSFSGSLTGADGLVRVAWTSGYLAITAQPITSTVNSPIQSSPSGGITVEVRFSDNSVDTSFNGSVTAYIFTNVSAASLGGTLTVSASSGIATFSNLTLDKVGVGYQLGFTCTDVTDAVSSTFDIVQPVPTNFFKPASRIGRVANQAFRMRF